MKKLFINFSISLLSVLFCSFVSEIFFRYFYVESDGLGITLSHKRWGDKYWKPVNSLSFRDREWTPNDLADKQVIGVLGDSFVAGHGIKNTADRFSNILANKLGNSYAVLNLGSPGIGTETELLILKVYPYKFDTVILSYFPNDILDAAKKYGRLPPDVIEVPKGLVGKAISSSYFLNFVYWNIFRIYGLKRNHFQWLQNQFYDSLIWSAHKEELEQICELTKSKNEKLIVVLFPFLTKEANSDLILQRVSEVFKEHAVEVLDVSKVIYGMKEKELVVSKIDAHPSVKLHELVGDALYKVVLDIKRLPSN